MAPSLKVTSLFAGVEMIANAAFAAIFCGRSGILPHVDRLEFNPPSVRRLGAA
jgi:hypothetical protein